MKLSLDNVCYSCKPQKGEIGIISKRIPENIVDMEIEEIANNLVQPYGKSWCPATFKNGRRLNENFQSQRLFGLDFDDGISFEDMIERCKKYNIIPAFVYTTFSSVDNNKFRVVFVLEHDVEDVRVRNLVQLALMNLFPETDKACKDGARIFFGGKELIYSDYDKIINIPNLIEGLVHYFTLTMENNYLKKIKTFCSDVGVDMINGYPKIIKEKVEESTSTPPLLLYTNRTCSSSVLFDYTIYFSKENRKDDDIIMNNKEDKPKKIKYNVDNEKVKRDKLIRRYDFDKLSTYCKLFKEMCQNEYWAYHLEIFGMATNLLLVEGGRTELEKIISQNNIYDEDKWNYYFNYINKMNYKPQSCNYFCPFANECEHGINMIFQGKIPRGKINILQQPVLKSLEVAEAEFKEIMEMLKVIKDDKIHVIKAPTGIGKTELYLDVQNTTIAVPNHKLKTEVLERMISAGNTNVVATPSLPENLKPEHKSKINRLYSIGAINSASAYIKSIAKLENIPELLDYLKQMDVCKNHVGTLITTHQKLMFLRDDKNERLIIDEDIVNILIQQNHIKVSDFTKLIMHNFKSKEDQDIINTILELIKKAPTNEVQTMPTYVFKNAKNIEQVVIESGATTNILGFLNCSHFIKSSNEFNPNSQDKIYFVVRNSLADKHTIILSATANEKIYKHIFGDKLHFIDLGDVENKGKIEQYPQRSFSRWQIKESPKILKLAQELVQDKPTITYKNLSDKFNTIATFGASVGLDAYGGQDIAIVGTPHIAPIVYTLFASALGLTPRLNDFQMEYKQIKRNNFEFFFQTFSDDNMLREIQLYLIESELIQAVGRARLLRNDCTVTVLSNLPITQADFIYLEKNDIEELFN